MDSTEVARIASTVGWLEQQQQHAQGSLTRLQQQVDQLAAMAKEYGLIIRGNGDDLEHMKGQLARAAGLDETIRRLQEQVTRLFDEEVAHVTHLERVERNQQADNKRLNQAFVETRQLIDPMPGALEALAGKLPLLADGLRRQQDTLAEQQKCSDLLAAEHRSLNARFQGLVDQQRRTEQEIGGIIERLEPMQQQDDSLLARAQILTERVKQIADEFAAIQEFDVRCRDLLERAQLQKAEHQSLEGRVLELSQTVAEQGDLLQESLRLIKGLDERLRADAAAAAERQRETTERWERICLVLESQQELLRTQRQREVTELQEQLRELKELAVWKEAI